MDLLPNVVIFDRFVPPENTAQLGTVVHRPLPIRLDTSFAVSVHNFPLSAWASTCTKSGGPNWKIIGSKNLVFFKTFKKVKSANFGFLFIFICPAIYSTNQI